MPVAGSPEEGAHPSVKRVRAAIRGNTNYTTIVMAKMIAQRLSDLIGIPSHDSVVILSLAKFQKHQMIPRNIRWHDQVRAQSSLGEASCVERARGTEAG